MFIKTLCSALTITVMFSALTANAADYPDGRGWGPYQANAMTGNRLNCSVAEYFNLRVARNDAS